MKTDLFQSCDHCWVFQICWHIECSTFTALSSRIWNSLTGIPSPPLALFVVMLSKAHLNSHFRMSGSRWVITPSWLSFLYSSYVYSCHLFLISSASVRSLPFLSFIEPIFAWNVPFIGDWNAKVGSQETPGATGKFDLGVQNEAGQRLIEFCQENAQVIANTLFQQHERSLDT